MIIGIEAERANNPHKTGVEHYAKQLILHLAKIDNHNQYILYLRSKPEEWFKKLPSNFKVKVMPFPKFWTQIRLSWEMIINPPDILFIPASALPIIHPKKSIITIHDIAWLKFPETFTWFNRQFLRWSTWYAARNAHKIISVSQATKHDLIDYYKLPEQKISVVHHGFTPAESEIKDENELSQKYSYLNKYILFLSTIQPRKNLDRLIDAFVELKNEKPELPHKLVVVGRPGWKFEQTLQKMERNKDHVIYLNYVPDADRFYLLKHAQLMVLPSLYEGFGMGILESFEAGTPVATAKISSMPEVAGNAALYFDPHSVQSIKQAIEQLIGHENLRHTLIEKGEQRLKDYSWKKCAEETLKIFTT